VETENGESAKDMAVLHNNKEEFHYLLTNKEQQQ
jgi:hypothetical protein